MCELRIFQNARCNDKKVHYRVYKTLSPVPVLTHIQLTPAEPVLMSISVTSYCALVFRVIFCHQVFLTKTLYIFIFYPVLATRSVHLIHLHLIT